MTDFRNTMNTQAADPFKMEMHQISALLQDAAARLRDKLLSQSALITGDGKSVAMYLSERLSVDPKIIYRILEENVTETDADGNCVTRPAKFHLNIDATRALCYDILHISMHELFFNEPAVTLIPSHLTPIAAVFQTRSFEDRASICDRIKALTTSLKKKKAYMQESSTQDVFYRALDELLDDQYRRSIEQLNGYSLAPNSSRNFLVGKAAQRKRFRIQDIMFLAKHQRTSVDRFISDLYFEHTDLAILENYVPKKLKDIDFFLATTIREYLTLSYEARKEVLPVLIRECYRF